MNGLITKFEAYLLTEKRVSHNTFDAYKRDMAQFQRFLDEKKLILQTVHLDELKKFLEWLHVRKIGARSLSRKISCLKAFYRWAAEYHGLHNPAAELAFPRIEKRLPQYLSEKDIEALLEAANSNITPLGVRNKVIVYLLYVSGMRISELVSLKKSHMHFDTGLIVVQGKGGKERQIPLPAEVLELMRHYFSTTHRKLTQQGNLYVETDYAFPVLYGKRVKPISRQAFWLILKKLARSVGIKDMVSPHKLRHSLATHLLHKGADLRSLQLLLGHENLSTVQIYTHLETGHLRSIYDKKHPRS
ncbi:tyrosine recombinase [Candidatus Babeliales bacterium]|nr:tyrosine recombinase [Candidatus Babeliales bacterium]